MEKLVHEFRVLSGIDLTRGQLAAITRYEKELAIWNASHNLTAIQKPEEVRIKHFLDSLSCFLALRGSKMNRIIDIGTGAGFPGIPSSANRARQRGFGANLCGSQASSSSEKQVLACNFPVHSSEFVFSKTFYKQCLEVALQHSIRIMAPG